MSDIVSSWFGSFVRKKNPSNAEIMTPQTKNRLIEVPYLALTLGGSCSQMIVGARQIHVPNPIPDIVLYTRNSQMLLTHIKLCTAIIMTSL
jgi:hypothetical protein